MSQDADKLISGFLKDIGSIFRYFLPGVLILAGACAAYPDSKLWEWLTKEPIISGIVALSIGSTWFILNRYVVHQLVDCILYHCDRQESESKDLSYLDHLGEYIRDAYVNPGHKDLKRHVSMRASSVLLIYTVGELAIFFSLFNQERGIFSEYRHLIIPFGVTIFVAGVHQNIITRRIDWHSVYPYRIPCRIQKTNLYGWKYVLAWFVAIVMISIFFIWISRYI